MDIAAFIEKWRDSAASERANKDSFLHDLCDVLSVPHPDPKTGDPDRDRYVFEREAVLVHGGDRHSIGFVDLYKHGCFILEAKQGSEIDSKKIGTARRGTAAWNVAMNAAFGQALQYASTIEPAPPFLIVTDSVTASISTLHSTGRADTRSSPTHSAPRPHLNRRARSRHSLS